jgi:hypothetical protein
MNNVVKSLGENFTGVSVYFDNMEYLIKESVKKLLKELPTATANKVYIPTRSAKLF